LIQVFRDKKDAQWATQDALADVPLAFRSFDRDQAQSYWDEDFHAGLSTVSC
jgi:hypothetical protein